MKKVSLLVGLLVVVAMFSGCAVFDDSAYRSDRYDRYDRYDSGSHGGHSH